jgi:hypothetical protein
MLAVDAKAYSDTSIDVLGRRAKAYPSINLVSIGHLGVRITMAGANPLVPFAPNIDTKLDLYGNVSSPAYTCYSGHLYGDAFPNAEIFMVNSSRQATMLHTFETEGDANTGPAEYLPNNNNRDMGSFSSVCVKN